MNLYAILGLNRFGVRLAREIGGDGGRILAIDNDEDRVEAVADEVDTAVIADIRDASALTEAGVTEDHVAIISVESNVEASALAVLAAKDIGCRRIVALARADQHARILRALGADEIIMPEAEAALRFAKQERGEDAGGNGDGAAGDAS